MNPTANDPSLCNNVFRITKFVTKFVGLLLCSFVLYQAWRFSLSSKEATVIHSEKNVTCSDSSYCDEEQSTTVHHLGWDKPCGRTNNHLFTILNGVNQVWDLHGDDTCQAVLAISGWALDTFCQLFCDSHWSLADNDDRLLPVVEHDELHELCVAEANQPVTKLGARDTFCYSRNASLPLPQQQKTKKQRTCQVLGILIQHFAERNLEGLKPLRLHLQDIAKLDDSLLVEPNGSVPHMAVHSRWLEGSCLERIKNTPSKDECHMPPSYIKKILASQGMLGRIPIVIVADLQQRKVLDALRNDSEIGPCVIVPALDRTIFAASSSTAQNDMVLAANSAIFVGTRASTMSKMIGVWRIAAGADPQSNYIHAKTTANGTLEVCADCI